MLKGAVRIVAVIVALGLLALPYAAPILSSFIDPVHGVAGASLAAGLPSGSVKTPYGEATVVWDSYGVPHIYAESDEAGVYALGWVTANMRLFQMDLLRRVGEGRLAALVGEPGYENDVFIRSIGLNHVLEKTWDAIVERPDLQVLEDLLNAYSDGVNAYIEYAADNNLLPIEYRVLGVQPEPWSPIDSLAISRVIALGLAWNDEDLVLYKLVERWGPGIIPLLDLDRWEGTVEQADCAHAIQWGAVSTEPNAYDYGPGGMEQTTTPGTALAMLDVDPILEWIEGLRGLWDLASPEGASNNWVVNGSYTESGLPILANDPHLQLSVPPIWFMAEIHTPSFKSIGVLFPGTPLIVIGRNEHLAWAFTNVMGDFTDYYYYVWDGDRYYYKGRWLEAGTREEKILVYDPMKRSYEERTLRVLETVHGPVLEKEGTRLAVKWTGLDVSFEFMFFIELNNASSVQEAITAQRWFHVPIQNFVVADDKGNFAYSPVGAYPVRANTPVLIDDVVVAGEHRGPVVNKGYIPFNGSNGEGEWTGYIAKEELPILYNPPTPYIVTANSKPWKGACGDFVGWHYADRYREERIKMMLDEFLQDGVITVEEVMRIQNDYLDLSILDYLQTAILPYSNSEYAKMLGDWLAVQGPLMDRDSVEPTIAMAWVASYHELLWENMYGSADDLSFLRFHYALSIVEAAARGDSLAIQLIPGGSLDAAAQQALDKALKVLRGYYGHEDHEKWVYGEIHYYNPRHPAFRALDYARIPANGGPYTVSPARPAEFNEEAGMPVTHGPSMRHVIDLALPDYWISLPGGQSGNPFSSHYQDIYADYWTKGEYIHYLIGLGPSDYPGPVLEFKP